jgi:hypothetical protein
MSKKNKKPPPLQRDPEAIEAHRELAYLRAASYAGNNPRRFGGYAKERWGKLQEVKRKK